MKQIKKVLVEWGKFLRRVAMGEKNKERDMIIISTVIVVLTAALFSGHFSADRKKIENKKEPAVLTEKVPENTLEKDVLNELKNAENTDMADWKEYKNDWFGFDVKYPKDWKFPYVQGAVKNTQWEQRVGFRKTKIETDDSYVGFDVVVYDTNKTNNMMNTQEFPALKLGAAKEEGKCDTIEGHFFETGDYPAEEIYVPINDDCYEPTLFFSFTKDQYIYNIVPIKKAGLAILEDQRMEISREMPEFLAVASTLKSVDIDRTKIAVRPKTIVKKRVISGPLPLVYKRDNLGRRVCNKGSNDHPGKSNQNKGKHMDMECCLDPDEYPNPNCYYSQSKYGKYL